ncbi:U3 small nucleolar ribonucleoprotein [Fasciola gigantica]|uniref:U3 small nucleolar ribonucleoprotein n=1 Tax=Fasciola gigantica TaxID=46835 RepID=A0A504YUW9_FASGI|nr:U3 small nucleolar ribonucleoprotein [Fasciola gigantica]
MEEAGPTGIATVDMLAPEEVCPPRGEVIKGSTELTVSDRRRHRRKLMRIRSKRAKNTIATDLTKDKKAAMARVIRMAHKPGSNVKVVT